MSITQQCVSISLQCVCSASKKCGVHWYKRPVTTLSFTNHYSKTSHYTSIHQSSLKSHGHWCFISYVDKKKNKKKNSQLALSASQKHECLFSFPFAAGNKKLNDREWHEIRVHLLKKDIQLSVDEELYEIRLEEPLNDSMPLTGPLYIGGLPKSELETAKLQGAISVGIHGNNGAGLRGCVRDVRVNRREENLQITSKNESVDATCRWTFPCLSSPCSEQQVCVDDVDAFTCQCPKFMADCEGETVAIKPKPATAGALTPVLPTIYTAKTVISAMEGKQTNLSNATLVVYAERPFYIKELTGRLFGPGLAQNGTLLQLVITRQPMLGRLYRHGDGTSLERFDLQVLSNGELVYSHDGAEEREDSFEVSLITEDGDVLESGLTIVVGVCSCVLLFTLYWPCNWSAVTAVWLILGC